MCGLIENNAVAVHEDSEETRKSNKINNSFWLVWKIR